MYTGGNNMLPGPCSVLGPLDIFFNDSSALSVAFLGQCLLDQLTPLRDRCCRKQGVKTLALVGFTMIIAVLRASFMTVWSSFNGYEARHPPTPPFFRFFDTLPQSVP